MKRLLGVAAAIVWLAIAGAASAMSVAPPSPEAQLITRYYRAILLRSPDAAGASYWEAQARDMRAGGADVNETWRALAASLYGSAEFKALDLDDASYLSGLYGTFLGRAPDVDGREYWTGQLARGLPREAVLLSFLFSAEFDAAVRALFPQPEVRAESFVVVDLYRGFLQRLPEAGGYDFWLDRLQRAQCGGSAAQVVDTVDALSRAFFTSSEYTARDRDDAAFVTDLYNAFLRRGAESEGFNAWVALLGSGAASREVLRQRFVASPEFQARASAVAAQGCVNLAQFSGMTASAMPSASSPFTATVSLEGRGLRRITVVRFTIAPKPGSASRPVDVELSAAALARWSHGQQPSGSFRIPVFGLYADYQNAVTVRATFPDGTSRSLDLQLPTSAFDDPKASAIYAQPTFIKRRAPGSDLGFDFFVAKSSVTSPVILDTDGEVRWWVPRASGMQAAFFDGGAFFLGDPASMRFERLRLDGTLEASGQVPGGFMRFHHNVDQGKVGMLVEVDRKVGDLIDWENILLEVAPDGTIIKQWNFADIIRARMQSFGEDPSLFVRLGSDWFHMNAATYDPSDDSIIASGREDFLIKVDYATGAIRWILGDPNKHWASFSSLRSKALTMPQGGRWPIGQHAVSVTPEGYVMVFNNGRGSISQPPGAALGEERTYSAVSWYAIDPMARTVREVMAFDHDQAVLSQFCSSAYEMEDSVLVAYAQANNATRTRFTGLDANLGIAFDFSLPNQACNTSWNTVPIALHRLQIR